MATESTIQALGYLLRPISDEAAVRQKISSSWDTSITVAKSTLEQRFSLLGRPNRTVDLTVWANSHAEQLLLNRWLARWANQRQYIPLYADQSPLTAQADAAQAVLDVDTTYRRFQVGKKVVVCSPVLASGLITAFEVGTISSMNASSITLSGVLAATFAVGALVIPLIEAEVYLTTLYNNDNYRESSGDFEATEVVGLSSLAPLATAGSTPSGYTAYGGYPILDVVPYLAYKSELGWDRQGVLMESGRGLYPRLLGLRPAAQYKLPLEFTTRAEAWSYLTFADSRAGRAYPFWVAPPTLSYELDSVVGGGTGIKVTQVGEEADWAFYPTIGVRLLDGTQYIRTIDSVTRAAGLDELTFDTGIGSLVAGDIERVGPAALVRYSKDNIDEEWITQDVMRTTAIVTELPVEADITVSDLVELDSEDLTLVFSAIECDGGEGIAIGSCVFSSMDTATFFKSDASPPVLGGTMTIASSMTVESINSDEVVFSGAATQGAVIGECPPASFFGGTTAGTIWVKYQSSDDRWYWKSDLAGFPSTYLLLSPESYDTYDCTGYSVEFDGCPTSYTTTIFEVTPGGA